MSLSTALQTIGTILALFTAGCAIWKVIKMTPAEHSATDAAAAKDYAEAAQLAAGQVTNALNRIDQLEKRSLAMIEEVEGLQETLARRDKCIDSLNEEIHRRDLLIEDWTRGIRVLIAQILTTGQAPLWEPKLWALPPNSRIGCESPDN